MSIKLGKAQKLTSPNPFTLITSLKEDKETNVMALSWWTYLANSPATICISLGKDGLTHELIDRNNEFGLNVVGEELKENGFKTGITSGRDIDKVKEFNIPLKDAKIISPKVIPNSRLVLECRVNKKIELPNNYIYFAEVVSIDSDENIEAIYAMDGYSRLDTI